MGATRQIHPYVRVAEMKGKTHFSAWERLNLPAFSETCSTTPPITKYSKCGKYRPNLLTFLLAAIGFLLFQILPAAGKPQLDVTVDLPAKFVTNAADMSRGRIIVIGANNDQSEFLDNLFGDTDSTNKQVERESENLERDKPKGKASYGLDYLNLESLDFGFAIEGVPEAAFSVDIPNFWNRLDNSLSHQLIFASPDSDPDAKATLAINGELANGRTDQDAALAHAIELVNIGDAEIIDSRKIETAAGPGWRVLLKVNSPSDIDMLLIDELVVIKKGSTLYQLELTAPEPIWHAAEEVMKRALETIFIWK